MYILSGLLHLSDCIRGKRSLLEGLGFKTVIIFSGRFHYLLPIPAPVLCQGLELKD